MDNTYYDLYIKYKDNDDEIVWARALLWSELSLYIDMFKRFNDIDIKVSGKSRIDYIRFE